MDIVGGMLAGIRRHRAALLAQLTQLTSSAAEPDLGRGGGSGGGGSGASQVALDTQRPTPDSRLQETQLMEQANASLAKELCVARVVLSFLGVLGWLANFGGGGGILMVQLVAIGSGQAPVILVRITAACLACAHGCVRIV